MKNKGQIMLIVMLALALSATIFYALFICNSGLAWMLAVLFILLILHTAYDIRLKKSHHFISVDEANDLDRKNGFTLDGNARPTVTKPQIIEIIEPVEMYDLDSYPPERNKNIAPGAYRLFCVPSLTATDVFWYQINDTVYGLPPLELKALILNGKARWRDK